MDNLHLLNQATSLHVLVLGTAGVAKREYMESVRDITLDENLKPYGKASSKADQFLILKDIEKELELEKGGYAQYGAYLSKTAQEEQQSDWSAICEKILDGIDSVQPTHTFLLTHAVYFRKKEFRSIIDLNLIRRFRPTVVLTLIDDAYDVSDRISRREQMAGTGSACSFAEAIEWRTVETMIGDLISRNIYLPDGILKGISSDHSTAFKELENRVARATGRIIKNFVVARKHNPRMVYRLLFERWREIVYASYPISSTRPKDAAIQEINDFRSRLHGDFTVFDPVTIDEFPVATIDAKQYVKRWPIESTAAQSTGVGNTPLQSFKDLGDDITYNFQARDFRLVNQSDCLVAYRPFYGGRETPASGVDREMIQALNGDKPIFVVHNPKVDGELTADRTKFKPIQDATSVKPTTEEIVGEVMKTQDEKKKVWNLRKLDSTWE